MYTLLLLLFACSSDADTPAISPQTTEPSSTPIQKTTTPPSPTVEKTTLPDLTEGLSREGCDNGPGESGAASYFVGELNISDNTVSGEEKWLLFANKKWKKRKTI